MTTTPSLLLRDACLTGLVLAVLGCLHGWAFGAAVGAGAAAAALNVWLLLLVTRERNPGRMVLRLGVQNVAAALVLCSLVATLSALPVLLGFVGAILVLPIRPLLTRPAEAA